MTNVIMKKLIVLASVLLVAAAVPIHFRDCTASNQTISVDISPCDNQPCAFNHSVVAKVRVTFKAPYDSSRLKVNIYGYVVGVKVPWPMPNPDGCVSSNISCPVVAGNIYTYTATLAVPRGTPQIQLVVEWNMISDNSEKQFCFDFPMQIISGSYGHVQPDHKEHRYRTSLESTMLKAG